MPTLPCGNANTETCCPRQVQIRIICFGLQFSCGHRQSHLTTLWDSWAVLRYQAPQLSFSLKLGIQTVLILRHFATPRSTEGGIKQGAHLWIFFQHLHVPRSPALCAGGRWLCVRPGCLMRRWQPAAGSPSETFRAQRDPQGCSSFLLSLLTRQEKNSQEKNKDTFGMHQPRQFQMSTVL